MENFQLPSGPGTVWNKSGYQGDILLPPLNAYETRLLSYAIDDSISVERSAPILSEEDPFEENPFAVDMKDEYRWLEVNEQETMCIKEEILQRRLIRYRITNRSSNAKLILLEHRQEDVNWIPQEAEENLGEALYRYSIRIPANTAESVPVTEITTRLNRYTNRSDLRQLIQLTMQPDLPGPLRSVVREWIDQIEKQEAIDRNIQLLMNKKSTCDQQQTRIKSLMVNIQPNEELYKRYLKKLADLEDEQEQIARSLEQLKTAPR